MPVGRSSATDETRERAEPEGRLLPPRDDPEAGYAKNLVSSGRGNGVPSNRAPELPGKRATRLRARRVDLDSPGVSQAIGRDRTHVARVYLPRNVGLYGIRTVGWTRFAGVTNTSNRTVASTTTTIDAAANRSVVRDGWRGLLGRARTWSFGRARVQTMRRAQARRPVYAAIRCGKTLSPVRSGARAPRGRWRHRRSRPRASSRGPPTTRSARSRATSRRRRGSGPRAILPPRGRSRPSRW